MNIAIIDDDINGSNNMFRMFTLLGVDTLIINSDEEFLSLGDEILREIDIFILDYNFSTINGVEIIKRIKKRILLKNLTFIIYTGDIAQIKKEEMNFLIENEVLQIEKPNIKNIVKIIKERK